MIRTPTFAAVLAFGLASQAHAAVFDFEAQTGADTSSLSIASGGLTATFTSPDGVFTVGNSGGLYLSLTGNALTNLAVAPAELDIHFSSPVHAVSLNFGLVDLLGLGGSDSLASSIGTAAATVPAGFLFPEGVLGYSGANISDLKLTSLYSFSIDNLVATPEPASLALLVTGFAGLVAARRRKA